MDHKLTVPNKICQPHLELRLNTGCDDQGKGGEEDGIRHEELGWVLSAQNLSPYDVPYVDTNFEASGAFDGRVEFLEIPVDCFSSCSVASVAFGFSSNRLSSLHGVHRDRGRNRIRMQEKVGSDVLRSGKAGTKDGEMGDP